MTKKKILIIEDNDEYLATLQLMLKREEATCISLSAQNGQEGLELAFSKHPDLILLDILMPKMDGLTMLKKLREDPWGKNVQVLILSNADDPRMLTEALKDEALDYLIKTQWNLKSIMIKINEILSTSRNSI